MLQVQHSDMTDSMHQCAACSCSQILEGLLPGAAVLAANLDLDQFVVEQCSRGFVYDALGEAGVPDQDHRLERVRESAQVLPLLFIQVHPRILPVSAALPRGDSSELWAQVHGPSVGSPAFAPVGRWLTPPGWCRLTHAHGMRL